jgi:hypothetical protein
MRGVGSVLNLAGTSTLGATPSADRYFASVDRYMDRAGTQLHELTAETSVEWRSPAVENARKRRHIGVTSARIGSAIAVFSGLVYLNTNFSIISLSVFGLLVLIDAIIVVDARSTAWRKVAAKRRQRWESRQENMSDRADSYWDED